MTVAGPEVPTEGSSGRLFGEIRDDPNATLVQAVAAGNALVPSAQCTTHDFEVVAHPTEAEIDTLVEDLDPAQVVITHQRGRASNRYTDKYNSFVWATGDESEHTIHEGSRWVAPPWMTTEGIAYVNRDPGSGGSGWLGETFAGPEEEIPLPASERQEEVDLIAEGLDMDVLEQRLRPSQPPEQQPDKQRASEETARADETVTSDADVSETEALPAESVAAIADRLDAIESQLDGTTFPAQVVDAGDGVTLLRVFGEVDREHGQAVEVTIRDVNEG